MFVGTVTEKLMTYALGRGLGPIDMPVVRSIVNNAEKNHYAMQSIILGIVQSSPFQKRTKLTDNGKINTVAQTATDGVGGPLDSQTKEAREAGVPSVGRVVGPTLKKE